jgi:hypothetical protein
MTAQRAIADAVTDQQKNSDNAEWMKHAQEKHAEATTAMQDLISANFSPARIRRKPSYAAIAPAAPADAAQGARIEQRLRRGAERDLDVAGHTRRRVGRVVPGLGRDARVAQEIRVVGYAVDHVAIDVEHVPVGEVRILRLGWADVRAGDVDVRMASAATAAAEEVVAARKLRIAGNRPVGEAVELDPAPKAAQLVPVHASPPEAV